MKFSDFMQTVTSISALGAAIASWWNHLHIKELHVLVNSRLTELLKVTKDSSFAEGEKSEKDKHDKPG